MNVELTSNIMALSYIAVQVFEQNVGPLFRNVPTGCALQTAHFDLVTPTAFFAVLKATPAETPSGPRVSRDDLVIFNDLQRNMALAEVAVRDLHKELKH